MGKVQRYLPEGVDEKRFLLPGRAKKGLDCDGNAWLLSGEEGSA